jgi:hypothetical protein
MRRLSVSDFSRRTKQGETGPDFRELVGRLDFGRSTGLDVTFSPDEAWVLREHIRALALLADPAENAKIKALLEGQNG